MRYIFGSWIFFLSQLNISTNWMCRVNSQHTIDCVSNCGLENDTMLNNNSKKNGFITMKGKSSSSSWNKKKIESEKKNIDSENAGFESILINRNCVWWASLVKMLHVFHIEKTILRKYEQKTKQVFFKKKRNRRNIIATKIISLFG